MIAAFALIGFLIWHAFTRVGNMEAKANQGDARSQYWLAKYYGEGIGGGASDHRAQASPPNYATAYAWAHIAELNGYDPNIVTPLKQRYEGKLTSEQISESKKFATEWIDENPKLISG